MMTNISDPSVSSPISNIFQLLGSPARVDILVAIGHNEACVCHLEAKLGWRQAYISQHLMALRKADLLVDRKEGRFVYYRLRDEGILQIIRQVAVFAGKDTSSIDELANAGPNPSCECPSCAPALIPLEGVVLS